MQVGNNGVAVAPDHVPVQVPGRPPGRVEAVGLVSSDTKLTADFALDKALEAIASKGRLAPQTVRRVAIVGLGLDFTDKAEGYDFYPQQTIQPFALIDSLTRLGLAKPDDLRVTTLDRSPRVNRHLEAARQRALAGEPYVLQLPLTKDDPKHQWHPDLVTYWQRFGERVGEAVAPIPPPAVAGDVRVRALRVSPAVTISIAPRDLDIIVERLEPLADAERFDLIVATNILVYYDAFDQAPCARQRFEDAAGWRLLRDELRGLPGSAPGGPACTSSYA